MKTLTFLSTLAVVAAAAVYAQTNTNRPTVAVPSRVIRAENTNLGATAQLPLRTTTNVAAGATNVVATTTNVAGGTTNVVTTTITTAAQTNVVGATPLTPSTNIVQRPATLPGPPAPGARPPGTTTTTTTTTTPPALTTMTPMTAVSTNLGDDMIIPPGMIKFQDADILHVLDFYQDLTGRTVVRPAALPTNVKITLRTQTPLTRREAVGLLDTILSMNMITMVPQGEKFVKAVPQAQAFQEARRFNELPHEDIPESGSIVAQVITLSNAPPDVVAQALQPFAKLPNSILAIKDAGILVLRDYAENVKRMMEVLEKIDVVPVQEFEPVVIPIKYALAADIAQVLGSLTAGGGGPTTVGRQTTRTGLTTGGGGFGQPGTAGMGGQPGQPGYSPQGTSSGIGAGGLSSASAQRSSFAGRLQQIVNRAAGQGEIVVLGNTKIIADERTNSLLIFASKGDFGMISNIINQLDVVLAQVLIEALVLEVGLNDAEEYGISYLQRRKKLGDGAVGAGSLINNTPAGAVDDITGLGTNLFGGFSYFVRWGDFDIALKAAANDGRLSVLSRPRIQTSHAVEANLFVGETRPYPTSSQFGGVYGNYAQIQQLQIGITLSVLPLINPDGLVVMDIRQKIQDVGDSVQIQGVGEVPSTIDREAAAKVAVRDGESIVLGGLISTQKSQSKQGVPFLKDVPILGWLFRSSDKSIRRRELMVFIRPTVLPTPESAAIAATAEKEKLPGISRAEYEVGEEERRRQEQYEQEKQHRQEKGVRRIFPEGPLP